MRWPVGHATDEFCLAFSVLASVGFLPDELVVKIRRILTLAHTQNLSSWLLLTSQETWHPGPALAPRSSGPLGPPLSTGRLPCCSPQSPPLPLAPPPLSEGSPRGCPRSGVRGK